MPTDNLKILAINSLPANGNAGLKMVMSVLGTRVIPVPSLLLSGIGNLVGHERFPVPLEPLLTSTLTLARNQGVSLVVYVGYLGQPDQAGIIAGLLPQFSDIIRFVLVDPVCGDNGRAYVSDAIIDSWHHLLRIADITLPNSTEIALLAGVPLPLVGADTDAYISAFRQQYPTLECVVTGFVRDHQIINRWIREDGITDFTQPYHPRYFSGTGDAFASLLLENVFFRQLPRAEAIQRAGADIERLIRAAIAAGSTDLPLVPGALFPQ